MKLADKHILITGAGRRVGRVIAEALLTHPHASKLRLTAHYRNSHAEAQSLAEWGKGKGAQTQLVAADLAEVDSIRQAVETAVQTFGPIDILINSASDFFPTPAVQVTEKDWDHFLDVNLKGQFFFAQAAAVGMLKRGEGHILNIADVNGERPMKHFVPYLCSKAGLLMMTRALAKEWAPAVRVNAISPGAVLLPESYTEEQRQRAIDRCLLKRIGSADDIAQGALFLIANDYITGFNLVVDGGRSLA